MQPSDTVSYLKEEVARALNDTADPPRDVKPDDIKVFKKVGGEWQDMDEVRGKGVRKEASMLELDIRGVGSGSGVDGDGETLTYTVKNGLESEETITIEPYPRDD